MAEPCTPSGLISVATSVAVGPVRPLHLVNLMLHPGSAASTVTVYDTKDGTVLALLQGIANGGSVVFPFDGAPVLAKGGINVTVAGTAAQAEVYFKVAE